MQMKEAISEFLTGYFSTHQRSRKTKIAYEQDLEQFGRYAGMDFELSSLHGTTIEAWAAHLRTLDYAPASMRRKIVVLKVFCGYWLRRGLLNESPFWRVKLSFGRIQQLPRALSESEMQGLLEHAAKSQGRELTRKGPVLARGH